MGLHIGGGEVLFREGKTSPGGGGGGEIPVSQTLDMSCGR